MAGAATFYKTIIGFYYRPVACASVNTDAHTFTLERVMRFVQSAMHILPLDILPSEGLRGHSVSDCLGRMWPHGIASATLQSEPQLRNASGVEFGAFETSLVRIETC